MAERQFSTGRRRTLAAEGDALPDGAYPIPDCDALRRAIEAYGRATPEERPALRRLIARRKVELGCDDVQLPSTWHVRGGADGDTQDS